MFTRFLVALLASASFAAAATSAVAPAASSPATAAVVLPLSRPLPPPLPASIMELPPELRERFHAEVMSVPGTQVQLLDRMVAFLFGTAGLGMQYQHDATYTVEQAFATRKANCLTFTLLSIALAREAGLDAYGQEIDEVLTWHQQGNLIYRANHVNAGIALNNRRRFTIDVAVDAVIARDPPEPVSDQRLLALFYNNRAAELMGTAQREAALRFVEISLRLDPDYATSWNTAGVVQLHRGDLVSAERHYRRALELDPSHSVTLFNLVRLHQRSGDSRQAGIFQRRLEKAQLRDPFHQFQTAVELEAKGDLAQALKHYQRAIRLHGDEHRFHFGLARIYLALGEARLAGRSLARAHSLSKGDARERYHAKLDTLRLRHGN